ncbi:Transcriptional activator of proteases prtT [Spathaspora sp. JA1]|nr:Transcriptional activator of proteases prtT [Spathaspora sp. JA1]
MVKEKRTKPCSNCKKSKVKCIYTETLPCQRCIKLGQISQCQFIPKLPSLTLPSISQDTTFVPLNPLGHHVIPPTQLVHPSTPNPQPIYPNQQYPPQYIVTNPSSRTWENQIENRMNKFDEKINDVMEMLRVNQQFVMELQQQPRSYSPSIAPAPTTNTTPEYLAEPPRKRIKLHSEPTDIPTDFRHGFLSKSEAKELFKFFDTNISQQLFGFEISKFTVDSLWDSCPILICAICTIASIHHPKLSVKSSTLTKYLHELCKSLLFQTTPTNETDGVNTIVALILCSFWMSDSQMFTGLALQLAKQYGLNNPNHPNKDRLKLWYLLYILDGQQSLTFNRQPLVNSQDYSLVNSRELLTKNKDKDKNNKEHYPTLTDLRLVSQVEYNQAINEAFKGNAWDLLAPESFGIPSKSNLELDKWMVSWTVLLTPGNYGAVWSTKSTLIYYNFAKMHINSSAVRQLQIDPINKTFPKWEPTSRFEEVQVENEDSDDSDSDSDSFISNKELVSPDQTVINANIAVNAAQTVLNLVINDKDILDNLKYIPVHIHIMLYYAALLLINPPIKSNNQTIQYNPEVYYRKLLDNLSTITMLKRKIYSNLPIDEKFGSKLIQSLQDIECDKLKTIKQFVNDLPSGEAKLDFNRIISSLDDSRDNIEILMEGSRSSSSSNGSTPRPEKISAWPGSNHGHP